jgi:hypothetical protein
MCLFEIKKILSERDSFAYAMHVVFMSVFFMSLPGMDLPPRLYEDLGAISAWNIGKAVTVCTT